jgi:hypothetical protein
MERTQITDEQLKPIAEHIARWTFERLISTTQIDHVTASRASLDGANEAVRIIKLVIEEAA